MALFYCSCAVTWATHGENL